MMLAAANSDALLSTVSVPLCAVCWRRVPLLWLRRSPPQPDSGFSE